MQSRVFVLCVSMLLWMLLLPASTLDNALEKLYQTKPHLRPACIPHTDEYVIVEQQEQCSALVHWYSMHRYIDLIALSYFRLLLYTTYHTIYCGNDNRWLQSWDEYIFLSGLKKSSLCGSFLFAAVPLAIKVYIYRMLAHMSLNLVRYGIVMPLAWIGDQLQESNNYENFSRHRIVCDH